MPNTVSAFYQTVVSAASEAAQLLAPTWKLSESVYLNYKPESATVGQTLNVPIPNDPSASVADIGVGDVVLSDLGFATKPLVMNKHPNYAYVVRDFESNNTPSDIRNIFMDAALKGVKNSVNGTIAALLVSGNFPTNGAIAATGGVITVTQFLQGMAALSDQKVPVANDPQNMSLILPSIPYMKMMDSTTGGPGAAWVQAFQAGAKTAEAVRDTGSLPTTFGMSVKLDQQCPITGTAPTRSFTAAYMHRWAIAVVTRPLPKPDGRVVDYTYVDFGGIPLRVSVSYNPYPKQGWIVNVDAGFGVAVIRENLAQLFSCAE